MEAGGQGETVRQPSGIWNRIGFRARPTNLTMGGGKVSALPWEKKRGKDVDPQRVEKRTKLPETVWEKGGGGLEIAQGLQGGPERRGKGGRGPRPRVNEKGKG